MEAWNKMVIARHWVGGENGESSFNDFQLYKMEKF